MLAGLNNPFNLCTSVCLFSYASEIKKKIFKKDFKKTQKQSKKAVFKLFIKLFKLPNELEGLSKNPLQKK